MRCANIFSNFCYPDYISLGNVLLIHNQKYLSICIYFTDCGNPAIRLLNSKFI